MGMMVMILCYARREVREKWTALDAFSLYNTIKQRSKNAVLQRKRAKAAKVRAAQKEMERVSGITVSVQKRMGWDSVGVIEKQMKLWEETHKAYKNSYVGKSSEMNIAQRKLFELNKAFTVEMQDKSGLDTVEKVNAKIELAEAVYNTPMSDFAY